MSNQTTITEAQVQRAREIWRAYQTQHDISALIGKAVGVSPVSGQVFFGDSATEIVKRRERDEGVWEPLVVFRVGADTYWHRGGRRR
jgi:hypothetical protein